LTWGFGFFISLVSLSFLLGVIGIIRIHLGQRTDCVHFFHGIRDIGHGNMDHGSWILGVI
jgi:hypothetical protein